MATQRQIRANRLNAKKSTGPRTLAGKYTASMNSLKHGLCAEKLVLMGEDPKDLEDLHAHLLELYQPVGGEEEYIVERMAKARFRMDRCMPLEKSIYDLRLFVDTCEEPIVKGIGRPGEHAWAYMRDINGGNGIPKLLRYEETLRRQYNDYLAELKELQAARLEAEAEKQAESEETAKQARATAFKSTNRPRQKPDETNPIFASQDRQKPASEAPPGPQEPENPTSGGPQA